jgi:hypothetical protein
MGLVREARSEDLRLVAICTWEDHGTVYVPIEAPQSRPGKPTLCPRSLQESATDSAPTEQMYLFSPRVPRPLALSWRREGGAGELFCASRTSAGREPQAPEVRRR